MQALTSSPPARHVDATNARYAVFSALGEVARGLEERTVALTRATVPARAAGGTYTVRIENDGAELVAQ